MWDSLNKGKKTASKKKKAVPPSTKKGRAYAKKNAGNKPIHYGTKDDGASVFTKNVNRAVNSHRGTNDKNPPGGKWDTISDIVTGGSSKIDKSMAEAEKANKGVKSLKAGLKGAKRKLKGKGKKAVVRK